MYPSKSDGMFVPESLIFRSDSNGEDLEGYAGAGLYDSITMDRTELKKVDYASDRYEPSTFSEIRAGSEFLGRVHRAPCKSASSARPVPSVSVSSNIMEFHRAKLVPWNLG